MSPIVGLGGIGGTGPFVVGSVCSVDISISGVLVAFPGRITYYVRRHSRSSA